MTGRVGIVGLGMVGGSLALDLRDRDVAVIGTDAEAAHLDLATDAGIEVVGAVAEVAMRSDLVVVAVPPGSVADVVGEVLATAPDVVVTDVASVKDPTTLEMATPSPRWVGGHPMAGTERTGFVAARPGLLAGATWLLTPGDDVDEDALAAVLEVVLAVQAVPVVLDAAEHDRLVAAVSHVTHLLSYALNGVAGQRGGGLVDLVAGPSFRDATRVAASEPAFWGDLVHRNRTAVGEVLDDVQRWLAAAGDEGAEALTDRLAAARRHPHVPERGPTVAVPLDDVPTAVARLRDLGRTGHAVTGVQRDDGQVRVQVARR